MATGPHTSANGQRVTSLSLLVPWYGLPVADVALATPSLLTSPVTLAVGNASFAMAIARDPVTGALLQRRFAGVTTARLVGGRGTWSTPVRLSPYRAPTGAQVRLSTVLGDLARATSPDPATREQVVLATGIDRDLGPMFITETGAPASRVLAILAGALWYIDAKGVTQIASTRPATVIKTPANVQELDGGKGWLQVATEDIAAWTTPGATFTSGTVNPLITVRASRVKSGNDGVMRIEVLT